VAGASWTRASTNGPAAKGRNVADLSQAETGRWFVEHTIALYDDGLLPETEVAVVRRWVKRGMKKKGEG